MIIFITKKNEKKITKKKHALGFTKKCLVSTIIKANTNKFKIDINFVK